MFNVVSFCKSGKAVTKGVRSVMLLSFRLISRKSKLVRFDTALAIAYTLLSVMLVDSNDNERDVVFKSRVAVVTSCENYLNYATVV